MANAQALKEAVRQEVKRQLKIIDRLTREVLQGNNAFRKGKYDEAVTCYSEAMKADPSESTYPLNRSMANLKLQKFAEAEKDASKSLNLLPAGNPKALYRRALARKSLGKLTQAQADLETALKEDASNAAVKSELEAIKNLVREQQAKAKPAPSKDKGKAPDRQEEVQRPFDKAGSPPLAPSAGMTDQRKSALKAAITPATAPSPNDTGGLMQAVSTRRLKSDTEDTSKSPHASQVQASPVSTAPPKKDFRALRAQRDERQRVVLTRSQTPGEDTDMKSEPMIPEKPVVTVPAAKTIYEFERRWKDNKDNASRGAMLEALAREKVDIPTLVGQNLSPELIDEIIACLTSIVPSRPDLQSVSRYFLIGISGCARFDFVSMLCANVDSSDTQIAGQQGLSSEGNPAKVGSVTFERWCINDLRAELLDIGNNGYSILHVERHCFREHRHLHMGNMDERADLHQRNALLPWK